MTYEICYWGLGVFFMVMFCIGVVVTVASGTNFEMFATGVICIALALNGAYAVHVLNLHATGQVRYELRQNPDGSTSWHWVDVKQEK